MKNERITSTSNPKIRELLSLTDKARERKEKGLFVAEGIREIRHSIEAGYVPRAIFYSPEIAGNDILGVLGIDAAAWPDMGIFEVSQPVYSKIAYRDGTEGIVAEIYGKEPLALDNLPICENPLVIVTEAVEKPGNIGAILRSADACGADALIICNPKCDLYNPNLIRASIGAIFTVPTVRIL